MLERKNFTDEYERNVLQKASPGILREELRRIKDAITINTAMGDRGEMVVQELMAKKKAIERILPEMRSS